MSTLVKVILLHIMLFAVTFSG